MAHDRSLGGKTLLVTGGAGFIGSNFIRFVLRRHAGLRVINLDKLTYAGNLDNLRDVESDPRYEFIHGDIRDRDLVAKVFPRVQAVVHFAAETHVDRSIVDAGEFVLTDVFGTYVLLEALRANPQVEVFVHISTDEVYGSRDEGAFTESDALNPSFLDLARSVRKSSPLASLPTNSSQASPLCCINDSKPAAGLNPNAANTSPTLAPLQTVA